MKLIINREDFRPYRDISDHIDASRRLDTYILEAQQMDLRPVLNACGKDFLYHISENQQDANIQLLLEGGTYTAGDSAVAFIGLKAALVYYTYARFIASQGVNITAFGVVQKSSQYSEPVDAQTVDRMVKQSRSTAYGYMQQCVEFLNANSSLFSMWSSTVTPNQKPGLKITSV